ncbi:MAG TPA: hypothetical protein PLV75_10515, partial [Saprospiraceae bacterium]|nr:hypothetical protein [Saprospiraceae bacterium]
FIEHRGITPDNLAYGGWGYGEPGLPYGEHGHVDISHTRRIVEALVSYSNSNCVSASLRETNGVNGGTAEGQKAVSLQKQDHSNAGELLRSHSLTLSHVSLSYSLTQSWIFLLGVQRTPEDSRLYEGCLSRKDLPYDGGLISSTVTLATNKCEPVFIDGAGYHYPSYATATCDGFLALHALGMTDTKAYADAKQWLEKNQDMSTIEGLSRDNPEQWHEVMHYYHWAVRAEAMTAAGITGPWSKELERMLINEQQPEGYYINPIGGVNKEDDPLMATIFVLQAGSTLIRQGIRGITKDLSER